jgi:20S proteasome alpha/beta subunit
MTIAMGMLCHGGAIIAVDGRATIEDGSVSRSRKLCSVNSTGGISFGIATATDDLDAAETLVRRIAEKLTERAKTIKKWAQIENYISGKMKEWAWAYGYHPFPVTRLIIGITIPGKGTRLYLCEPPNTVLPKEDGYVAVGSGAAVTDPLFRAFFTPLFASSGPQYVCRGLAYLMYRAKKENAFCGDPTDAIYLDTAQSQVTWINGRDFKEAENASFQLDLILQTATTAALTDSGALLENNASGIKGVIIQCERLRETVFHTASGKIIGAKQNRRIPES